jgi:hypothetical protein
MDGGDGAAHQGEARGVKCGARESGFAPVERILAARVTPNNAYILGSINLVRERRRCVVAGLHCYNIAAKGGAKTLFKTVNSRRRSKC